MLSQVSRHICQSGGRQSTATEKRSREGQKQALKGAEKMREEEKRAYPSGMMLRAQDRQWLTLSAAA